jgi:hypothetical protein
LESRECPTCRGNVDRVSSLKTCPLLYRIWSETQVKCGNHEHSCPWTGSIADLTSHMKDCTFIDRAQKLEREVEKLKMERKKLKGDVTNGENNCALYKGRWEAAARQLADKTAKVKELERDNEQLKMDIKTLESKCADAQFDGQSDFDRFTVVALTQLISRYIDNKPENADKRKIFASIRSCNEALEKNLHDNPVNFRLHMHMLFVTSLSSSWFTNNQCDQIEKWMAKQEWSLT